MTSVEPSEGGMFLTADEVRAADEINRKLEAAVRVLADHFLNGVDLSSDGAFENAPEEDAAEKPTQ